MFKNKLSLRIGIDIKRDIDMKSTLKHPSNNTQTPIVNVLLTIIGILPLCLHVDLKRLPFNMECESQTKDFMGNFKEVFKILKFDLEY